MFCALAAKDLDILALCSESQFRLLNKRARVLSDDEALGCSVQSDVENLRSAIVKS